MRNFCGVLAALLIPTAMVQGQCTPDPLAFPRPISGVEVISSFEGELVVGGSSAGKNYIAHWDGTDWQSFGDGPGFGLPNFKIYSTTLYNDELYAAGGATVSRWDGSAWHRTTVNGTVYSMEIYRGELIVAGAFAYVDTLAATNIARWDGTAWRTLGIGLNKDVTCLLVHHDELYAAGRFTQAGGAAASFIARWDGAAWSPVAGGTNGVVGAMTIWRGDLIAGGGFTQAGGLPASLIARFDGVAWHDIGGGVSHTTPVLGLATALVSYRDQLIVGGNIRMAGGVTVNSCARWTGDEWLAVPGFSTFPYTMAVFDGDFYAAGSSLALRRYGCPPCLPDLNADGQIDFSDYLAYVNLYTALDIRADLNEDGLVDHNDFLLFLDTYSAGCA